MSVDSLALKNLTVLSGISRDIARTGEINFSKLLNTTMSICYFFYLALDFSLISYEISIDFELKNSEFKDNEERRGAMREAGRKIFFRGS